MKEVSDKVNEEFNGRMTSIQSIYSAINHILTPNYLVLY